VGDRCDSQQDPCLIAQQESGSILPVRASPVVTVRNPGLLFRDVDGILLIRDLAVVMVIAGMVGWVFQRIGLSVVVGYLLAGILIGPYTPPFQLVNDLDRIQTLAQLGLVFLTFSIGLGLSFARLQRLGLSIAAATLIGALIIFNICKVFGATLGWSSTTSLVLAAMLMVSSSAIISKVLEELNLTHQRPAQLALGITVLEDVVAIVMLTLLTSVFTIGQTEPGTVWKTIGALSAFVVLLVFLSSLLIPRILKGMGNDTNPELRALVVTGIVLSAAFWAVRTGFSLALGAFVLGVVIAGTRYKDEVARTFEGLKNIFGAVFFVAVGMLFDVRLLPEVWGMVLMISALVLFARPLACSVGLVAVGNSSRHAVKAGIMAVPIGEFSFVIAQVAVAAKAVPESFYGVAVGVSVVTSIASPALSRHSDTISHWIDRRHPEFLRNWVAFYHRWLTQLHGARNASVLWKLTAKRVVQTGLQLLFVSALVLVATPLYHSAVAAKGHDWLFPYGLPILFWIGFGFLLLAPVIAIWRNIEALAMIFSEGATRTNPRKDKLRPLIQLALKSVASITMAAWLMLLLPFGWSVLWALFIVVAFLALLAAIFWRRLIKVHSKLEVELRESFHRAATPGSATYSPSLFQRQQDWNLQLDEVSLPSHSEHAGRTIKDLALRKRSGCSIVGIDRQGFLIGNPKPTEALFPGDKLLLLGNEQQLTDAEQFLRTGRSSTPAETFEDLTMETVRVPDDSPQAGATLIELDLLRGFSVQICGIERGKTRTIVPAADENIRPGDTLLVLGTHDKIHDFRSSLEASENGS
jgi:CPA2 family monovalent cation:H+ antiporter-2